MEEENMREGSREILVLVGLDKEDTDRFEKAFSGEYRIKNAATPEDANRVLTTKRSRVRAIILESRNRLIINDTFSVQTTHSILESDMEGYMADIEASVAAAAVDRDLTYGLISGLPPVFVLTDGYDDDNTDFWFDQGVMELLDRRCSTRLLQSRIHSCIRFHSLQAGSGQSEYDELTGLYY